MRPCFLIHFKTAKDATLVCVMRSFDVKAMVGAFLLLTVGRVLAIEPQVMSRHLPEAAHHAQVVGRMPADQHLTLSISLPLRNPEALTQLLADLYNPASPRYRQFLTPEQFALRFGPSEQDYQTLIDYAQAQGFTIVHKHANRTRLTVHAPVANVERALGVTLRTYQHPTENRLFHAPDADPSIAIPTRILSIQGLSDFSRPKPTLHHVASARASGTRNPQTGSMSGLYMGNDFRAAYVPGTTLDGTGQSVGLMEFDGYNPNDIAIYESLAGLPSVALTNVLVDGTDGTPQQAGWVIEVCLDIEMAISMAPGLSSVIVYEAGNNGIPEDILNQMVNDNAAKQLSASWVFGPITDPSLDPIFQQMAAQGQTYFQASGDWGAYAASGNPIQLPVDSPYITAVGGTVLNTSGTGGPWSSETAWNWSGGGISAQYTIPSWQQGIDMSTNQGSTTMRNLPDVAMVAENVFVVADDGWELGVDGTSCSAPLWAGFMALINQQAGLNAMPALGYLNPAIYAIGTGTTYTTAFHDITSGNNFNGSSPSQFTATGGYDLCTGWGTPNGTNLINALVPFNPLRITPLTGATFNHPPGQSSFIPFSGTLSLSNAGASALSWGAGSTSTWFALSSSSGILASGGTTEITIILTSDATNMDAQINAAIVWFTNSITPVVQNRALLLYLDQPVVLNGGFETGDTSYWSLSGTSYYYTDTNGDYALADLPVSMTTTNANIPGSDFVHTGLYGFQLGAPGSSGYLSQTLQTVSGMPYLLSFWLQNSTDGMGGANEFLVQWAGNTLFDQTNMPLFVWTNLQFVVVANSSSTLLTFGARNDNWAFGLDDISAQLLPLPMINAFAVQTNTAVLAWIASTNVHYQIQTATNLSSSAWTNQGSPVLGTNAAMSTQVSTTLPSPQFYRVLIQP